MSAGPNPYPNRRRSPRWTERDFAAIFCPMDTTRFSSSGGAPRPQSVRVESWSFNPVVYRRGRGLWTASAAEIPGFTAYGRTLADAVLAFQGFAVGETAFLVAGGDEAVFRGRTFPPRA